MSTPRRPSATKRRLTESPLWKTLGPGVVMAGAAVGVSHLVQSTRAGAEYGYLLLGVILLTCLFKYPFLEFGPRYAAATGESLVTGYRRMGRWVLWAFMGVTVGTMFVIQASVTLVTAGIAGHMFGTFLSPFQWSALILLVCGVILVAGRYRALDRTMKAIMAVLAILTVAAVVMGLAVSPGVAPDFARPDIWTGAGIAFVIALMGWMPIPLDVAVWHSLWTLERRDESGHPPSIGDAVTDFNLGYVAATIMAVLFLVLGATVMYGTGEPTPEGGVAFAARLIELFEASLGGWSAGVIGAAALVTMFSTTLAVTDGFPRVLGALAREFRGGPGAGPRSSRAWELAGLVLIVGGALLVLSVMSERFTQLIDATTTFSFLTTPLLAAFNLRLLTGPHTPAAARPPGWLVGLAWSGLVFLLGFCTLFVYGRFLM
ncbi:MAG: Nramp family divalent metal transporter [Gemmatimonadota bacterium]